MQEKGQFDKKDLLVMKLLHYFITCCGYHPVIVKGVNNEIWLENLNIPSGYKIIRIVSDYIHNKEQYDYDINKAKSIIKSIKKKTFNINMNTLTIFTDLNDNVEIIENRSIDCVALNNEKDIKKYKFLYSYFPNINEKLTFTEQGVELFIKITSDINEKNKKEAKVKDDIFKPKKPIITYVLIGINVILFLMSYLFDLDRLFINLFSTYGPLIRMGDFYRLISGGFIHLDVLHILFNMWALYTIGSQVESFFGKAKYIIIYLMSLICGGLLSILFSDIPSIGASGAIFGLLGALLYFGYNYRVYLGNVVKTRILPVIILNLMLGFMTSGIDNFAHIGGLLGGLMTSVVVGINGDNKNSKTNAIIIEVLYIGFLLIMNFVIKK